MADDILLQGELLRSSGHLQLWMSTPFRERQQSQEAKTSHYRNSSSRGANQASQGSQYGVRHYGTYDNKLP